MRERDRRVGENELLFREVNERVKEISDTFNFRMPQEDFICECGDESCTQRVRVSAEEYEQVRSRPTHFFVLPGHELPDVETVVRRLDRFFVVEKNEGEPAELATAEDPRS